MRTGPTLDLIVQRVNPGPALQNFDLLSGNSPTLWSGEDELAQSLNVCREPTRPHLMFPCSDHHMELLAVLVVSYGARVHDHL
jgi:hypothetical protein